MMSARILNSGVSDCRIRITLPIEIVYKGIKGIWSKGIENSFELLCLLLH